MTANRNAPNDGSMPSRAQVRKTYTGKLYGRQDDLIIALQLALIGAQKFSTCTRLELRYRYGANAHIVAQTKTPSTAPSAPTTTPRRRG